MERFESENNRTHDMERFESENNRTHDIDREKALREFDYQRKYIERITGLSLSNIEAMGLRKITEEVVRQIQSDKISGTGGDMTVTSTEEIPARFFHDFYDIPVGQFDNLFRNSKVVKPGTKNSTQTTESAIEWFRREQEARHLI